MKKRKKRITVPVIMQMEALECGAASLAMILAYHGKWLPLEQVRSDCGVSRDGSKASSIAKAGRSYGLEVKAHRYGVDEVKENVTYPAIIHWNFNHFVVLCGFTKNAAVINDPARGTINVTMEEFDHSFTGVCIEFTPGENFEKGGKPESVFKFLKDRLANTTASVIFVMITAALVAFVGLVTPVFARIFTDQILPGHNMHWLEMLLVAMLFTAIFRMIVGFLNEIYLYRIKGNISKEKITLFCLPFAGGGASAYNQWAKKMQGKVTVCPVQLPGREEQIMEKPYIDMSVMLDDLEEAVRKVVYGPYALWGHSMGGKIAYELEKRLEAAGYTAKCLFISGSRVPSIPEPNPIYHLPDEEFKRELGRFEGTPKEILENQELLDFFLPMLRADFTMDETYYDKAGIVLHTPIAAFGGEKDGEADESAILEWGKYTDNDFNYRIFPGGHFYLRDCEDEVISEVMRLL